MRCVEDLGEAEWRVRRDRDALQDEIAALRAQLAETTEQAEQSRRVWMRRHTRLSEAVGMDPGYSADQTVNEAIRRCAQLAEASRDRDELRYRVESLVTWAKSAAARALSPGDAAE